MKNLTLTAVLLLFTQAASAINIWGGVDIDHSPIWKDYRQNTKVQVERCTISVNGQEYLLNNKGTLQTSLEIIKGYPRGEELVENFNALVERGELRVRELIQSVRDKYNMKKGAAALYVYEGTLPATIYISSNDEQGLLSVFLYHEISHALDRDLKPEYDESMVYFNQYKAVYDDLLALAESRGKKSWENLSSYLNEAEDKLLVSSYESYNVINQRNAFRAERYAFDQQDLFVQEISSNGDCYKSYIEEHRQKNKLKLYLLTPDSFILSAYGIDQKNLEQ